MTTNYHDYFISRISKPELGQLKTENKFELLQQASRDGANRLRALANTQKAEEVAREQANSSSLVNTLGLDPTSLAGNTVNLLAHGAAGASRQVIGNLLAAPSEISALTHTGALDEQDHQAYNRQIKGQATVADLERLNSVSKTDNPYNQTKMDAFANAQQRRDNAKGIRNLFNIDYLTHKDATKGLTDQLGETYDKNANQVSAGWNTLTEGKGTAKGLTDIASGLGGLIFGAGEAALDNKMGAASYMAENLPQLLLGLGGKAGTALLTATNVGYASENYNEGLAKYQKENQGAFPPEADRQRMALAAASLALAEQLGDVTTLKAMVMPKKALAGAAGAGEAATRATFKNALFGTTAATAKATSVEALTEGYQTMAEGEARLEPASLKDMYVGAAIGGMVGGGITAGTRGPAELLAATAEASKSMGQSLNKPVEPSNIDLVKTAITTGDVSGLSDPTKPSYAPQQAIQALFGHSQKDTTDDATKQANLSKADEIISTLETELGTQKIYLRTPEETQAEIVDFQTRMQAVDPADTVKLGKFQAKIASLEMDLKEDPLTGEQIAGIKAKVAKLETQISASTLARDELSQLVQPDVAIDDLVNQANQTIDIANPDQDNTASTASIQKVITLAMASPGRLTAAMAMQLSGNASNGLTAPQREFFRVMGEARLAQNMLMNSDGVEADIYVGNKNKGIFKYQKNFSHAVSSGNQALADKEIESLDRFAEDHGNKAHMAAKAWRQGVGTQIVSDGEKGWFIPKVPLSLEDLRKNGGLSMDFKTLVNRIKKESEAIDASLAEMSAAYELKFNKGAFNVTNTSQSNSGSQPQSQVAQQQSTKAAGPSGVQVNTGNVPAKASTGVSSTATVQTNGVAATTTKVVESNQEDSIDATQEDYDLAVRMNSLSSEEQEAIFESDKDFNTEGSLKVLQAISEGNKVNIVPSVKKSSGIKSAEKSALKDTKSRITPEILDKIRKTYNKISPRIRTLEDQFTEIRTSSMDADTNQNEADRMIGESQKIGLELDYLIPRRNALRIAIATDNPDISEILQRIENNQLTAVEKKAIDEANPQLVTQEEFDEKVSRDATRKQLATERDSVDADELEIKRKSDLANAVKQFERRHGKDKKYPVIDKLTKTIRGLAKDGEYSSLINSDVFKATELLNKEHDAAVDAYMDKHPKSSWGDVDFKIKRENKKNETTEQIISRLPTEIVSDYSVNAKSIQDSTVDKSNTVESKSNVETTSEVSSTEAKTTETVEESEEVDTNTTVEEAKAPGTLSVLSQKSPEGTSYKLRNLLADYFTQSSSNEKDNTKRPLVEVKDFISQLTADKALEFLSIDKLNEQQISLLKLFKGVSNQWQPLIKANLSKQENLEYRYRDLMQFFLQGEGKTLDIEENTKTALIYAGISWIVESAAKPRFNSPKDINSILNRDDTHKVTEIEQGILGSVGTRQNVVSNGMGKKAVQALGIKESKDAKNNLMPQLESQMGIHVLKLLLDEEIIERITVSGEVMASITTSLDTNKEAEHYFIRLTRDSEGSLHPKAVKFLESVKGTQGVLDKLFSVESEMKEPTDTPTPYKQAKTKNTDQKVPSVAKSILEKENAVASYVHTDMWKLANSIDTDTLLEIAGGEDLDGLHAANIPGAEATNDALLREITNFKDYVGGRMTDGVLDLKKPMYFDHTMWKPQRVGIATNLINPQASKVHRHMLYRQAWETEIDLDNKDSMEGFILRVGEGLGIKTDKQGNIKSMEDSLAKIDKVSDAVAVLTKMLQSKDVSIMSAEDQQTILTASKLGGEKMHSLASLMALAQMSLAIESNQTKFKVQLMGEVDGVTNGPMLSHLMLGAATTVKQLFSLLNKGGFYEIGNEYQNYNLWRAAENHFDLYESTTSQMMLDVQKFINEGIISSSGKTVMTGSKVKLVMGAIYSFTGALTEKDKVSTKGRKIIKTPLTAMVFGSSTNKAVQSMADNFVSSIYESIQDTSNEKKDALSKEQLVENINLLLAFGNAPMVPFKSSINELMSTPFTEEQIKGIQKTFKSTLGQAVKNTMEREFADFIEQRKTFNTAAQVTHDIYNSAYKAMHEQMRNEQMDIFEKDSTKGIPFSIITVGGVLVNGKRVGGEKVRQALHDLSAKEINELGKRLIALKPVMHSAMSKDSNQLSAGLYIGKTESKLSTRNTFMGRVTFGKGIKGTKVWSKNQNKFVEQTGISTTAFETVASSPSVSMSPISTHSADSATMHYALKDSEALNIHDAKGVGVGGFKQAGQDLNASLWNVMLNYSPANEMYEALARTARGYASLEVSDNLPKEAFIDLVKSLMAMANKDVNGPAFGSGMLKDLIENAKEMAFRADDMKYQAMEISASFDQYALEGGNYEVTDSDRQAATAKRSELVREIDEDTRDAIKRIEELIYPYITEDQSKVVKPKEPDIEEDQTPKANKTNKKSVFGELGNSTNESAPGIARYLSANTGIKANRLIEALGGLYKNDKRIPNSEFNYKLLSLLSKLVPEDLKINYITEKSTIGDVLSLPSVPAHAWYASTGDKREINVLSTDFVDSMVMPEVLVHELVHAALENTIERVLGNPEDPANADAIALINELNELRAAAIETAQKSGVTDKFAAALGIGNKEGDVDPIHEFVTWGMTNKAFQDEVLSKVTMRSKTARNALVKGMEKFIEVLAGLVFGSKSKIKMTNGLSILIRNVSGLAYEASLNNKSKAITQPVVLNMTSQPAFSLNKEGLIKGVTFKDAGVVAINKSIDLTPRELHALKLHEVGVHYGLERMIGKEAFNALLNDLEALKGKSEAVDEAFASVPSNTPTELIREEALAYLVENYHNMSLVKRIVVMVGEWFAKLTGQKLPFERDAYLMASASLAQFSRVRIRMVDNLQFEPKEGFVKLDFDKALKSSPKMHELLDKITDAFGDDVALTGSLALSKQRIVYRSAKEQIHDLDFVYQKDLKTLLATLKEKFPEADLLRSFSNKGAGTVVTIAIPGAGVKILSVVDTRKSADVVVTGTINGGEPQILTTNDFDVVDFFASTVHTEGMPHEYIGADGNKRTTSLTKASETMEAKFRMGRTKDLQDAIFSGDGNAAFSLNTTDTQKAKVDAVGSYSTMDIFNALGVDSPYALNQNASTQEFKDQLQDLLAGMVEKLHGPFGAFKAAMQKNEAGNPLAVWLKALETGNAPFASSILASGFTGNSQQDFVIEQVEATVRAALNSNEATTKEAYRELANLYTESYKRIKPADFLGGLFKTRTLDEAQAMYDFVFKMEKSNGDRSDYLSRFAALGLAHQGFNKLLKVATERNPVKANKSFTERLQNVLESLLQMFQRQITKTYSGQNADEKLNVLVGQLVDIEAKKKNALRLKANGSTPFMEEIEASSKKLADKAIGKIEDALNSKVIKNSNNAFVRASGSMTRVIVGNRLDWFMQSMAEFRDKQFKGELGVVGGAINSIKGPIESFSLLLRASKDNEGKRKQQITYKAKFALQSFANLGKGMKEEAKAAVTAVFLRTGAHNLLGHFSLAEIENLLGDKQALEAAITKFETELNAFGQYKNAYIEDANGLGHYKAIGVNKVLTMKMNAYAIAHRFGEPAPKLTDEQLNNAEAITSVLATLFALRYMPAESMKNAKEVLVKENARTDGNGVLFAMELAKELEKESMSRLFKNNPALMVHGYTSEIYNYRTKLVTATEAEGKILKNHGYSEGAIVPKDPADPDRAVKRLYRLADGGLAPYLTGVMGYDGSRSKGSQVHSGYVNANTESGIDNGVLQAAVNVSRLKAKAQTTGANPSRDLSKDQGSYMAPVFNESGDLVNWRYLMSESNKDTLLERVNDFDKVLGTLAGSIQGKQTTIEQNKTAIEAMKEQYDSEYATKGFTYVKIGPKSESERLRTIWAMLPDETKQDVKDIWGRDGLMVQSSALDLMFGYRKLSAADMFNKANDERTNRLAKGLPTNVMSLNSVDLFQKIFIGVIETLLTMSARGRGKSLEEAEAYAKRASLLVSKGERGWQELVSETKDLLVVKTGVTLAGNIFSNFSLLYLQGVSVTDMLKNTLVAFKGATTHRKDSEELDYLKTLLTTNYTQGKEADIKRRIVVLENAIQRNPVNELIEAGLMPTIAEDLDTSEDVYSFKSELSRKVDKVTSKLNPGVVNFARGVYMAHDTKLYRGLSHITQMSDFVARYALYQHEISKTKDTLSKKDAIAKASNAFVNYDVPMHRTMQYSDDMGFTMFTKYFLYIQKELWRITKENPFRVYSTLLLNQFVELGPIVLDSSLFANFGDNPLRNGALGFPTALDNLLTVNTALAIVK